MAKGQAIIDFWKISSDEEKAKRLKIMFDGRKKADSEGKGRNRILKGKKSQKDRIIRERIASLKNFSYILPNNDLRKLNIFLESDNPEIVRIAKEYQKHIFNKIAAEIDDSISSKSYMFIFNKYWLNSDILGTELYKKLHDWKIFVIKSFNEKTYVGYNKPLHHSKKYLSLPDQDIVKACIEFRVYLYNAMVEEIENIQNANIKHKRQTLVFNKYYFSEEIKNTKLYNYLSNWKIEEIKRLKDRSYILDNKKHAKDYLLNIFNSDDIELSNAAKDCLKYYIDTYILPSIDDSNTRMSSFVVFNTYYQKEYIEDTKLKKYLDSFKAKILKSFQENDPSIISKRNRIPELLDKLSNINDEDISSIAKKIKKENYNKIESLKKDNGLKEDFISLFNGYYVSNIISGEKYQKDDEGK